MVPFFSAFLVVFTSFLKGVKRGKKRVKKNTKKRRLFASKSRFSQRISNLLKNDADGGTTSLRLFNPQTKFGIFTPQF